MGSLDSILSSSNSEQRWVHQISKHFAKQVAIDISDVPVCVFNVPKAITAVKPDAYIPQVIALGPYHHMRPELYHMERYKVAAVRAFLRPNQIMNFHDILIRKLKEIEPTIRACYHKYLDLDDETLAWIMAIDGLFFLELLSNYSNTKGYDQCRKLTQDAILYRDVMVLENQIPFILLTEIWKALKLSSACESSRVLSADETLRVSSSNDDLFFMLKGFCKAHSPLKLARKTQFFHDTSHLHILDLMYHLIVNRRATKPALHKAATQKANLPEEKAEDDFITNVGEIVKVGLTFGAGKKVLKPVEVIANVPWEKISNLIGLKTVHEDNIPLVEEISIPSVSHLSNYGGIKFSHTIGGIRDVEFVEEEATLYLPIITLNANSEVLLRNLVAYEVAACDHSTLELAQYVDMMCGIINTAEDARLLREKGIIKGSFSNEEIVNLFNGMNKTSRGNNTIEKINKYYNKIPVVKTCRFIKRRMYASWRVLTVLSTIFLFLLLFLHSFCQVYGCPHFFGRSN